MIPTRLLRRPRLLIVGLGDVGMRTVALLTPRFKLLALHRRPEGRERLRAAGVVPVPGDLDHRESLHRSGRLAAAAFGVMHFAPPPGAGTTDLRTQRLLAAIAQGQISKNRGIVPERCAPAGRFQSRFRSGFQSGFQSSKRPVTNAWTGQPPRYAKPLIYASTTGVYGDCGGALIDETRPVRPGNARAVRRVDAERRLRAAGSAGALAVSVLRIPGIYAAGRLPDARLRKGTPALQPGEDVFTSHIHADDLAAIAVRALWKGRPQRLYHATDDSRLRMGEYFDQVADALGLPRAPRISRAEAEQVLEPMMLSFMRESRRLANHRLTDELRFRLRYPTVDDFLAGRRTAL